MQIVTFNISDVTINTDDDRLRSCTWSELEEAAEAEWGIGVDQLRPYTHLLDYARKLQRAHQDAEAAKMGNLQAHYGRKREAENRRLGIDISREWNGC